MQAPKVGAIVFSVKDVKRTEKFYREILGLPTELRAGKGHGEDGASHWLCCKAGEVSLIFFQRSEKPGPTPVVVFELENGIDDVAEKLAAEGVQIVAPVSEAPGGWSLDFLDPDHHMFAYYQPAGGKRSLK